MCNCCCDDDDDDDEDNREDGSRESSVVKCQSGASANEMYGRTVRLVVLGNWLNHAHSALTLSPNTHSRVVGSSKALESKTENHHTKSQITAGTLSCNRNELPNKAPSLMNE